MLHRITQSWLHGGAQKSIESEKATTFMQKLEKGENIKVGALGTSLTGGETHWFAVMKEWLNKEYPEQLEYCNKAVSASASSYPQGSSGLEKMTEISLFEPDVEFI